MNNIFKHANTNPSLWINVGCLLSALLLTAMHDEWVKSYPIAMVLLGVANFSVTSVLQYLRDVKHAKDTGIKIVAIDSDSDSDSGSNPPASNEKDK